LKIKLSKNVLDDYATPEELKAIEEGERQIANGEYEEFNLDDWK